MTTDLSIHLLGSFQVSHQGRMIDGFRSDRERALLAYLAVEAERPHRRTELVGLLWSEMPEDQARNNLRVNLHRLRKVLRKGTGKQDLLLVGRDAVQVNLAAGIWLDVAAFQKHLKEAEHLAMVHSQADPDYMRHLARATALYRDDFLKGFIFEHSPVFFHWAVTTREKLHRDALHALSELAMIHQWRGELREALDSARRQLELEPWSEGAHRQMMGILARSGERSAALAQFQICKRVLAEELGVEPELATIRLYDQIQAAKPDRFLNFSSQSTPLIGRKKELAMIAERLADPACRLLTLTGLGGIGKTRLALQAAQNQAGAFLQGAAFIPLTGTKSPEFLISAITDVLGLTAGGQDDLKKQLLDYLQEKEMLLVLDSFEHLLEGASILDEILQNAPAIKMLVTSRESLHLSWEWLIEVDGLLCPESAADIEVGDYSAVQLFVQSACRVQGTFSLLEEKGDVVQVCRLLAGMPLGIELAAARVREYSCREITQNIQRNFDLLSTSMRDVAPRHRSLQAAFEHSWTLLTDEEKRVLSRLSVFKAGFDRPAAREVAGASAVLLSSFVDKSLLRRTVQRDQKVKERYEMHELIRQFSEAKLEQIPTVEGINEKENTQNLHCQYYMNYLRQRAKYMRGEDQPIALEQVRSEIENLRFAWRYAVEHDKVVEIGDALLVMLHFYEIRGWFQEAENFFALAVQRLEGIISSQDEPPQSVLHVLGWGLCYQGWYAMRVSQYDLSKSLCIRAITIAKQLDDRELEANCLDGLGVVAIQQGDLVEARRYLWDCYTIFKEIGDYWFAAGALANLGQVSMMQGDYEEAYELTQESLLIKQQSNDKWGIATRTYLLGEIAARIGDYTQAESHLKESMRIFQEIDQQWRLADPLKSLAKLATQRGDYTEAQDYYRESLLLLRDTGSRERTAMVLAHLGETNISLKDYPSADRYFKEALEIAIDIQAKPVIHRSLLGIAAIFVQANQGEQAVELVSCVINHPSVELSVKERSERLLGALQAELPPEIVASALERGAEMELDDLAQEILVGVSVRAS